MYMRKSTTSAQWIWPFECNARRARFTCGVGAQTQHISSARGSDYLLRVQVPELVNSAWSGGLVLLAPREGRAGRLSHRIPFLCWTRRRLDTVPVVCPSLEPGRELLAGHAAVVILIDVLEEHLRVGVGAWVRQRVSRRAGICLRTAMLQRLSSMNLSSRCSARPACVFVRW